jgi:alpha-tubulin suppressor-like RCC1 family protein
MTWTRIAAGENHSMALTSDGTLWTWGHNLGGQLGDGTDKNIRPSPVRIGTALDWSGMVGGTFHTIALKTDGSFWAWGFNGFGQLGDGTTTTRLSPTPIGFQL